MTNFKIKGPKIISKIVNNDEDMWNRKDIQVNEFLSKVYKNGFITDTNEIVHKFRDTTNPLQGRHLYNLVRENKYTRTLEIGLAMGASAAWICQAHKDNDLGGKHIAIDPNQTTLYKNLGLFLIKKCKLNTYLKLIELKSYIALPILLNKILAKKIPKFQLIYIDGWHTFDYTLLDFFYSDLILEVGGVIVIDDIKHRPVNKAIKYISTNYPHYKLVQETPVYKKNKWKDSTQATFIKMSEDTRVWNFHVEF